MEERCKEIRGLAPQLLNLIPDERDWKKVREAGDHGGGTSRAGAIFDADADAEEDDDEELELKLGLPGVKHGEDGESCSALSLGCFPAHSMFAGTGAKRGFFDTVEARPEGCDQRQRDMEGCGNELTLGGGGESMLSGERKKGCCPPPPPSSTHGSAAAAAPVRSSSSSPQGRTGGEERREDSDATPQEMIVGVIPRGDVQDDKGVMDAEQEHVQGEQQDESNEVIQWPRYDEQNLQVYSRRHRREEVVPLRHDEAQEIPVVQTQEGGSPGRMQSDMHGSSSSNDGSKTIPRMEESYDGGDGST